MHLGDYMAAKMLYVYIICLRHSIMKRAVYPALRAISQHTITQSDCPRIAWLHSLIEFWNRSIPYVSLMNG